MNEAAAEIGALVEIVREVASDRKLRLFACACCRSVLDYLWSGPTGRDAVVVAERFADGLANAAQLESIRDSVVDAIELYPGEPIYDASYWACRIDIGESLEMCLCYAANVATRSLISDNGSRDEEKSEVRRNVEFAAQTRFLHDIFGDSPIRPVTLDPRWQTSTVLDLARVIYEERAYERLPILADALMDAGCDNDDIVAHCRAEGPHARGCWVVDLLLDKK